MKLWNNYIGKRYLINNPQGKVLQPEDLVIMHMTGSPNYYAYLHQYGIDSGISNKLYVRNIEDWSEFEISEESFIRMEPVMWWSEENRTIQSPIFKSLAAVLNIPTEVLSIMPGYKDGKSVYPVDELPY